MESNLLEEALLVKLRLCYGSFKKYFQLTVGSKRKKNTHRVLKSHINMKETNRFDVNVEAIR